MLELGLFPATQTTDQLQYRATQERSASTGRDAASRSVVGGQLWTVQKSIFGAIR